MSENLKLGMESLWYGINLWISCLVFLLPLRRKTHFKVRLILSGAVCVLILSGVLFDRKSYRLELLGAGAPFIYHVF